MLLTLFSFSTAASAGRLLLLLFLRLSEASERFNFKLGLLPEIARHLTLVRHNRRSPCRDKETA
jgi:hypothetical protein